MKLSVKFLCPILEGATTPLILIFGTTWRRVPKFTPRQIYSRERNPVSME